MKRPQKFLSCALVAMLLLALFPLPAQAATTAAFSNATDNGTSNTTTSTEIELTFDQAITGLTKDKIVLTNTTAAGRTVTVSAISGPTDSGTNKAYTLTIAGSFNDADAVTVGFTGLDDYTFNPTTKSVTLDRKPSSDVTIEGIKVLGVTATVNAQDATKYTVTVPFSVYDAKGYDARDDVQASEVIITTTDGMNATAGTPATADSGATWTIEVTAEDGVTEKDYTVAVTFAEESTDATLKSIVVLGQTARISGTTATVSVPYATWHTDKGYADVNDLVAGTDITATPNYVTATSATAGSGASWLITVTAEDGSTKKDYTLTVAFAAAPSSGGNSGSGSNGSWPGDNYPPAPPPPAEVLPGTPGSSTPTTPSMTNPFSFRVLARSLNVRSGPGTSFAKVGTLRANDVVSVVGYSADGLWAQTQSGSWVSLAYVSQVVSVDVGDYIVTVKSGSLNVRSGPGTSSAKIGSLANNALVMVHSVTNGWAQIEYNGGVGYVSVLYLR